MERVIKNKRYNTETAKELGDVWHGMPTELDYTHETLYHTKGGQYFIHGEGGPKTQYAVATENNGFKGGEKIIPLSESSAREWAEKNLKTEDYDKAFNSEEVPDKAIYIKLSPELRLMLENYCKEKNTSMSKVIRTAIAEYIK